MGVLSLVAGCTDSGTSGDAALAGRAAAGTEAYVCNFAYDSQPGATVATVDVATQTRGPWVDTGSLPSALAATADGRRLLVTDQGTDRLVVLDTATDDVIATISTGVEPDAVAVSPDGHSALVANIDDDTVTPVNLTTMRSGTPIAVGSRPDAVAIGGPSGSTALVADFQSAEVTPVDLTTMTAGSPIAVGNEPDAIAMSPDGTVALVANFGDGTVTPIDVDTMRAGPPLAVGVGPTDIDVAAGPPTPTVAWVTTGAGLVPVNLDSVTAGPAIRLAKVAEAVALSHNGRTAWVADQDGSVTPVALSSGRVGRAIYVGGRPSAIVIPAPRR